METTDICSLGEEEKYYLDCYQLSVCDMRVCTSPMMCSVLICNGIIVRNIYMLPDDLPQVQPCVFLQDDTKPHSVVLLLHCKDR